MPIRSLLTSRWSYQCLQNGKDVPPNVNGGVATDLEHGDAIKVNKFSASSLFCNSFVGLVRVNAFYFAKVIAGVIGTRDIYLMSICSHNVSTMDNNTS